ncbi:MAG: endolytic transglycosylase MltG [Erysipelotrichaceae bacterium]|nr:endolytic transglycosylase MltG [Erysipelotrichaceae bacterium]
MKNKKKIIGIIIGVIIVIAVGAYFYYQNGISAVSSNDEEVIVDIEEGTSASGILDVLDNAGLVNDKLCGKIFLKLNTYDNLQANSYVLNKNMSLKEIFDVIQNPTQEYINSTKLTIIEGSTISDNATVFAEILGISEDEVIEQWADTDFLNSLIEEYWFLDESILDSDIYYPLEGYLYPKTYYIDNISLNLEDMTRVVLDMMDEMLSPYQDQIEETGWSVHESLTFCSVVEKESGTDESDRSMIAGVFKNRLDSDMLLQSDITVNYAWQRTGVDVSISQTQIDSKYNTYKYTGLPIGPICCVPISTIESCLNYSEHDYYYFFAQIDPDDSSSTIVVYSKTYEEHQEKVQEAKDNDLWLS